MERVRRTKWLLAAAVPLAAGLATAALLVEKEPAAPQTQEPPAEVQQTASAPEPPLPVGPQPLYELGIWQGNVAVFLPGEQQPQQVTETPAAALPTADQEALLQRLPVYDRETLASLLEDYGS